MQNNNNGYFGNPYYNPYNGFQANGQTNNFQSNNQAPRMIFSYVQGIEGAKAFFVQPNQTVFLRDSEQNILYEKSADFQGRTTMKIYELHEVGNKPNVSYVPYEDFNKAIKKIYKKLGIKYESDANANSNVDDGE